MAAAGLLQRATACLRAGLTEPAAEILREVLLEEPDHFDANRLLGAVCQSLGELGESVVALRRAIRVQGDHAEAHNELAISLLRQNRFDAAIAALQQALALKPDFSLARDNLHVAFTLKLRSPQATPPVAPSPQLAQQAAAHNQQGLTLLERGQFAAAIAAFRQAVLLQPDWAETWCNLGSALRGQGDLHEAIDCYWRALEICPDLPELYNNLGVALQEEGELERAAACYHRALSLKPDCAATYGNLGLALVTQGKLKKAETAQREAARLQPSAAWPRVQLAQTLLANQKTSEATALFQEALQVRPQRPAIHLAWAQSLCELGRVDEAIAELREVLRLDPRSVGAYALLSNLNRNHCYCFASKEIEQMHVMLEAAPESAVNARVVLLFALAHLYDEQGQYDAAFGYYRAANELKQSRYVRQGIAFDVRKHQAKVDERIAAYTPALFADLAGIGHNAETPIFIVGMPRSGTTLVNHILSAHSQVNAPGELKDIPILASELTKLLPAAGGRAAVLRRLNRETAYMLAERYLLRLQQLSGGSPRVTDKLPANFCHLGFISLLFPNAKIIHCRRHPLDTCLSCYMQDLQESRFTTTFEALGAYYQQYRRIMDHWRRVLPIRMLEVQYEDLVARQAEVSREMLAYCGLPWEDACLAFHKNPRRVHTASYLQVRQPIYNSSLQRWRRYEKHLQPLVAALGDLAAECGVTPTCTDAPPG
jgi:tetratricopeptide (TPR) repeat protein